MCGCSFCLASKSCLTLCDPRLLCPWDSPGKNIGVGCHALHQGIFLTQGSNPHLFCLLHWQVGSLPLASPGQAPNLLILPDFYESLKISWRKFYILLNPLVPQDEERVWEFVICSSEVGQELRSSIWFKAASLQKTMFKSTDL